jgi:hypothetical protein
MSETPKNWFDIDRKGLGKLIARRGGGEGWGSQGGGKIALLLELIANAFDADGVTLVEVVLEPEQGVPHATVVVSDDSPGGFENISHAWTLFAESSRKAYPTKRGRFDLGEKLVLARCVEASIISTKAAVMFDNRGRSAMKARRERGTEFQGIARITRAELAEIKEGLRRILVPQGITLTISGAPLPSRVPLKTVEGTLATEISDVEGTLRRSTRKTMVDIHAYSVSSQGGFHACPVVTQPCRADIAHASRPTRRLRVHTPAGRGPARRSFPTGEASRRSVATVRRPSGTCAPSSCHRSILPVACVCR